MKKHLINSVLRSTVSRSRTFHHNLSHVRLSSSMMKKNEVARACHLDDVFNRGEPQISKQYHGGKGKITRYGIFNHESAQTSTMQIWDFDVGSSEGIHVHDNSEHNDRAELGALEEIYMVLRGTGSLQILDRAKNQIKDVMVDEGQAVCVPEGVHHGFRNEGDSAMRVLIQWGPPAQGKIVRYRTGMESTATEISRL